MAPLWPRVAALRRSLDSPLVALLITASLYGEFVYFRLRAHELDPSAFVTAGDVFCDPARVPDELHLLHDSAGYDGQYYYRVALNPLTRGKTEFGITFDRPGYRHQRILYPLLAWCFGRGSPRGTAWAMIGINYAALCVLALLASYYARSLGRHALWALLFAFFPGLLLCLARDLAEPLATALLVGGLWAARTARPVWTAFSLSLAVLTRESTLLLALVLSLSDFVRADRRGVPKWLIACRVAPLFVYMAWQAFIRWWWQATGPLSTGGAFSVPLYGFLSGLATTLIAQTQPVRYGELLLVGLWSALAVSCLNGRAVRSPEGALALSSTAFAATLAPIIWVEDWGFLRILSDWFVTTCALVLATSRWRRLTLGAVCWATLWVYFFYTRIE